MQQDKPITIKAYTASGQLLISKPVLSSDVLRLAEIFADMHMLGVVTYFTKQGNLSKKHSLKTICYHRLQLPIPVPKSENL